MHIIPVIHYLDDQQAIQNATLAYKLGCSGVFLIDMTCTQQAATLKCAGVIRDLFPALAVGVNQLGVPPAVSVEQSAAEKLDMTWTDKCLTHTGNRHALSLDQLVRSVQKARPHLAFVGVAFKYQEFEPAPGLAAADAHKYGLIPTTSGPGTGQGVDHKKLEEIRIALPADAPLALASGITAANIASYRPYVTHALVATSVTSDDGSEQIIESALAELMNQVK
ncbi:hypothetical protein [Comamonas thiooxydans]|uniref:hypothetical protein n=1 Tax=Comamonas thiooxydans TaxID=363952 RepID=UPI000B412774|nr:hypothetical protein [Comamonas thiooxydans]